MEINFDKEMDALLRQTVRREINAPAVESHLDTDELAAFSANALPVKARARAMEHLVDCGNCRTILSNLVFFEHQEEEKTSAAFAAAPAASGIKEASLLERIVGFFKFPVLAYGMACLVLVFGAAMALVVFRGNSGGVEMAQLSKQEAPAPARGLPAQDVGTLNEAVTQANSNAAANAPGIVSAVNSASAGGVFTVPASTSSGYSANTSSNLASSTLKKDSDEERLDDSQTKVNKTPVVIDSIISNDPEPKPVPPPASDVRQEMPQASKPQNAEQTRSQDNFRSNNNIMMPDGSDKDRKRAVPAEAGANLSREVVRDEKEKLSAADAATSTPAKNESKKAAAKKTKKKTAAAEASAPPPPNPTPTPSPEKKKPDDEPPPCR